MGSPQKGNPFNEANLPTIAEIEKNWLLTTLQASGLAVGLPWSEPGNSEVGHSSMGSGRIIYQYMPRIIFSIRDGSFFKNEALLGAINHVKEKKSDLHLMGLFSSGSVHSYIDHLYALLEMAAQNNISHRVKIHIFTDGKDSSPKLGLTLVKNFTERINILKQGKIATIMGRFWAMDRDQNWDRTKAAYFALTGQEGTFIENPLEYIQHSYDNGIYDESIKPAIVLENSEPVGKIKNNDAVIFFNFREDSVRQFTKAFVLPEFKGFDRELIKDLYFATMTKYEESLPVKIAFEPIEIKNPVGKVISGAGLKQIRIAETEKYAHVTYFFNAFEEKSFPGEDRVLIPSQPIEHFEDKPEMRALEIGDKILEAIDKKYDFILANFANADMIGHTGNYQATVKALEAVDMVLGKILKKILSMEKSALLISADHGNAEMKINEKTGEISTEHTMNPIPFYLIVPPYKAVKTVTEIELEKSQTLGFLSDIGPTILDLLGLGVPKEMTGKSLIKLFGIKI
ncbi:MAG: 2,3-bisphosphoglycerate-independent phosphoglycerate mutase [Parcubacteria group bacterium]|nr:2,3-bisphosphoglycerate-independent phosphoglycerate mutase [Parcubacteria group bacterium]